MRAALIHYDVERIANEPGNAAVMRHFGLMPNLQLLCVAAVLERLGVETRYIDMPAEGIAGAALDTALRSFAPGLVGLSVYTSHFHAAKRFAARVKSILPNCAILVGGVHCRLFPAETLELMPAADYVCSGEAETVLPRFVARLRSGLPPDGLPGIAWRDGGKVAFAGHAPPTADLDGVPFPARHLAPNHRYRSFISSRRNYTVFSSSRGCPFRCLFCEAAGTRWRARGAASVAREFEECHERFGIREIDVFDSSFTVDRKRVLEICRLLVASGLNRRVVWNIRSRVDAVDRGTLEALREAGCYRIFYGIESGDPGVLRSLRKSPDVGRVDRVVRETRAAGISPFGYFIVGSPGETRATVAATVAFAKRLPLDFAIFNALVAYPGTALYAERYLPAAGDDFWARQLRSETPLPFMGRPWTALGDDEVRRLAHRAMLSFYLRPVQIARALRNVRSLDQVGRYVAAGIDMVASYLRGGRG